MSGVRASEPSFDSVGLSGVAVVVALVLGVVVMMVRELLLSSGELVPSESSGVGLLVSFFGTFGYPSHRKPER